MLVIICGRGKKKAILVLVALHVLMSEIVYVLRTSAHLREARSQNWQGTHRVYVRHAAKNVLRRQKFLIYVLSCLRFIVSHQLKSFQVPQQWFQLKIDDLTVTQIEIDKLINNPGFLFRFSKHNYRYWKKRFTTAPDDTAPDDISLQGDIEMATSDVSCDLNPTYPTFHSIKDRIRKSFLNYRYANWVRKLDYDPGTYLSKYFSTQLTSDLFEEFKLSPLYVTFINDPSVHFVNGLSAVTTGYFGNGQPCQYSQSQFILKEQMDYANANKNIPQRKTFHSWSMLGSKLILFRAQQKPRGDTDHHESIATIKEASHTQESSLKVPENGEKDTMNAKSAFHFDISECKTAAAVAIDDNVLPLLKLWDTHKEDMINTNTKQNTQMSEIFYKPAFAVSESIWYRDNESVKKPEDSSPECNYNNENEYPF